MFHFLPTIFVFSFSVAAKFTYVDLTKAKAFLAKKSPCVLALANVESNSKVFSPVICVWDGVASRGTVNEESGCFIGRYDLATDEYLRLADVGAGFMAAEQPKGPCTKETVQKMVLKIPMSAYFSYGGEKQPVFVDFRKNTSKQGKVLVDRFGVIDANAIVAADRWTTPKAKPITKLKDPKKINCEETSLTMEDSIYCSTAEDIVIYCNNNDMSEEEKELRKAIYKMKTGKALDKCD